MEPWVDRRDRVTAVVLAGGRSRRMGCDKALLRWQGRSLLDRACGAAAMAAEGVVVVAPTPERYQSAVTATPVAWLPEGERHGPVAALALALEAVAGGAMGHHGPERGWVLLLACDLPLLEGERLRRWRGQLREVPPSVLAWVPQVGDRWEPLCGFYRLSVLAELRAFLAAGGRSFQPWLSELPARVLPLNARDRAMLYNCNRPDDLRQMRALDDSF